MKKPSENYCKARESVFHHRMDLCRMARLIDKSLRLVLRNARDSDNLRLMEADMALRISSTVINLA